MTYENLMRLRKTDTAQNNDTCRSRNLETAHLKCCLPLEASLYDEHINHHNTTYQQHIRVTMTGSSLCRTLMC